MKKITINLEDKHLEDMEKIKEYYKKMSDLELTNSNVIRMLITREANFVKQYVL